MHKIATISEGDLERLYELKYKHGWLSSVEREYGNLPTDAAYLKKAQIEDELYPLIEKMTDEFLEICSGWLEWHDISSYDRLNEMVDGALMELATIPEYGESIEYDTGDTAENLQWFEEIVNEIPEARAKELVQDILNYYNQDLLPALTRVENAKDALEEAKNQGIKEQLNSLELAITTAHQNGELGETILGTSAAKAKQIFDALASDKHVPQWDREISSWLGHPIGTLALASLKKVVAALKNFIAVMNNYELDKIYVEKYTEADFTEVGMAYSTDFVQDKRRKIDNEEIFIEDEAGFPLSSDEWVNSLWVASYHRPFFTTWTGVMPEWARQYNGDSSDFHDAIFVNATLVAVGETEEEATQRMHELLATLQENKPLQDIDTAYRKWELRRYVREGD